MKCATGMNTLNRATAHHFPKPASALRIRCSRSNVWIVTLPDVGDPW
jgi:hypothetical protein